MESRLEWTSGRCQKCEFSTGGFISGVSTDCNGHGTNVAGIIGAIGDNNEGIAGVCWNIKLVSLQVLNAMGGGYSSYLANAVNYAEELGIPILNFSGRWDMDDATQVSGYDYAMEATIENYAGLFICAAGNENKDNDENDVYPANFDLPNLITVGASNKDDQKWVKAGGTGGSNYGKNTVDLFAPGEDVLTTNPEALEELYIPARGSSMAAPYVTGVAALILSEYPDLLPCEIKDTILSNVDNCGTTFDDLCVSGGRLNAYKALTNIIKHTKRYLDLGASAGHRTTCTSCLYKENCPHDYEVISKHNALQHAITCACGNAIYEAHKWNTSQTKCLICGYNLDGPVELYALKPDEE